MGYSSSGAMNQSLHVHETVSVAMCRWCGSCHSLDMLLCSLCDRYMEQCVSLLVVTGNRVCMSSWLGMSDMRHT